MKMVAAALKKARENERGQITLDFLFATVLILSVAVLLGAMCFALTLTEIVQYVSFSTARAFYAGEVDPGTQQQRAAQKAHQLLKNLPFLAGAEANDWIIIDGGTANVDNFGVNGNGYAGAIGVPADNDPNPLVATNRDQFTGAQITFSVPILEAKIPLFGALTSDNGPKKFKVSSFLMREPTTSECIQYMNGIYQALLRNSGKMGTPGISDGAQSFVAITDNGC
jgi:hypothetical protein